MESEWRWTQKGVSVRGQAGLLSGGIILAKQAFASGLIAPVIIAAYVLLIPVIGSVGDFELFNGQRIFQLLVLGIATVPLLFHEARTRWLETFSLVPVLARVGLSAILGAGCVSATLAPLPRFAFLEVGLFVLLVVLTITLADQFQRNLARTNTLMLVVLSVGVLLYMTSFAVGYVFSLTSGLPVWPKAFTGFAHIRFFNQYQVWTLPLVVLPAALLPVKQKGIRYSLHTLAALWYTLLFASGGRGATLAILGAAVLMLLLFRKRTFLWLRLQLGALAAGLILYGLLFIVLADNLSVFSRLQEITQDSGRFELWGIALDMMARYPILGEGPMQFARYLNGHASHPHNAVLQWAAEWGLPSVLVLIGLVGWGFASWVRRCRRDMTEAVNPDRDLVLVAVTASLTTAVAYALVDGVIVMPLSQLLSVAIVGWVIALYNGSNSVAHSRHRSGGAALRLLVVLAAAWVAVGSGTYPDMFVLEEQQIAHVERTNPKLLHPRFWQQGFIEP